MPVKHHIGNQIPTTRVAEQCLNQLSHRVSQKLMNKFSNISLTSTMSQNTIWNWRVSFVASGQGTGRDKWEYFVSNGMTNLAPGTVQLKRDGTQWRKGGEVMGKDWERQGQKDRVRLYSFTLHSALHTHTHTTHTHHTHTHTHTHTHANKDWINMQPLDWTDSVNDVF